MRWWFKIKEKKNHCGTQTRDFRLHQSTESTYLANGNLNLPLCVTLFKKRTNYRKKYYKNNLISNVFIKIKTRFLGPSDGRVKGSQKPSGGQNNASKRKRPIWESNSTTDAIFSALLLLNLFQIRIWRFHLVFYLSHDSSFLHLFSLRSSSTLSLLPHGLV